MTDTFRTIQKPSTGLYKEKGSKFLAFAFPVESEDEIKKLIIHLKKDHHDARHICYAWVLKHDGSHYRSNDDGEPSGTAGKPILGQIQSHHLTNTFIAIVRYFGGTLLGTAGLVIAYRSAAADALLNALIVEKNIEDRMKLSFPYNSMNAVMQVVKDFHIEPRNQHFDMDCSMELMVRKTLMEGLTQKILLLDKVRIEILNNNS